MTDSTLPPASLSTAANGATRGISIVSVTTCALSAAGRTVTEATTGVGVVSLLLHAAMLAPATTTRQDSLLMHHSLPLRCRARVVSPASNTSPSTPAERA